MALFTDHTGALLKFYQQSAQSAPSRREAGRPDSRADTAHECYLQCRLVFSRGSVRGGGTWSLAGDRAGGEPVVVEGGVLRLTEVTLR